MKTTYPKQATHWCGKCESGCDTVAAERADLRAARREVERLRKVEEAAKSLLRVAYVGNGQVVCPAAFESPLRELVAALSPPAKAKKAKRDPMGTRCLIHVKHNKDCAVCEHFAKRGAKGGGR